MRSNWIKPLVLAMAVVTLVGCATDKEQLLTHGGQSMQDIWQQEAGDGGSGQVARRRLLDARQTLRRPLQRTDLAEAPSEQSRYTRTASNEIYRQFHRLPIPIW